MTRSWRPAIPAPATPLPPGAVGLALLAAVLPAAVLAGEAAGRLWILLVFAPLAEEIVFRLGLHEALLQRGWARWPAGLVVALAFALAHLALRGEMQALAVAVPALAIGLVYQDQRKLAPCVLLHALMNGVWLVTVGSA
ncbi:JDVT-CTERM system glutamic-type intramembrane protease [Zoogloea sp.]|uniref:JDVT-CTERM system glutamic-type intramembrane protease MrtJ n=1 Tax=Zoogloea sp. TaxID=49181 RepID=UPI0014164635|nr:MAG: JDVT-CTERM system CAAX-type protease [Zoogloea sp.]